jgi:hypothetical protein
MLIALLGIIEMPSLSRDLVKHKLPIKPGFKSYKQPRRNFNSDIYDRVKEEINWLLMLSLLGLVGMLIGSLTLCLLRKKGTKKLRVCIDFRDLNKATPKDEYPMPIPDLLVNSASGHRVLSFLDGNAGYNQIFMVEEDISKTAFICPGFVGLFE